MSRSYRIKIDQEDTWYHCYNRTAGACDELPFDDVDKANFIRILKRVSNLYGVKVVSYTVMSNHYHLVLKAPKEMMSEKEVCWRYHQFHNGRKSISVGSEACAKWQMRTRDISWFMRHLQQLYTTWFNGTRPAGRRGKLWADRFKHTILEEGQAAWNCLKYIEKNAYEAGMVKHPGDYRFCSYGVWRQSGKHPCADNVEELVAPMLGCKDLQEVWDILNACMTPEEPVEGAETQAVPGQSIKGRVRYWVCGLVIGSEIFVRTVMAPHHQKAATRRITKSPATLPDLFAWRRVEPVP
jgi:putative transposase